MEIVIYLIMGAVAGSFLNMLIYRLPREMDTVFRRSHCVKCKHTLSFLDLVPLISYISTLGKCRYCGERISVRYLVVEFLSVGLWFWVGYSFGLNLAGIRFLVFFSAMIVVFFTDLETHIIPDRVSLLIIPIGFMFAWQDGFLESALIGASVNFIFYYLIALIAEWYYKKPAIGGGDLKLAAAFGAFWGWQMGIMALYFAFIIGGVIGLFLLVLKQKKITDYIPFGPSLVLGVITTLIWGEHVWKLFIGI